MVDDLEESVISFLNKDGDNIYIGIDNNSNIVGLKNNIDFLQRKVKDLIISNIEPSVLGLFDIEVLEKNNKKYLKITIAKEYEMPTCPATISGIHVTNTNNIILDKRIGLSCPWFWLDEPQLEVIGNIQNMNYDEIVNKILEYRVSKISDVENMEKHVELYPFGGCGGNAKQLLRTYLDVSRIRGM